MALTQINGNQISATTAALISQLTFLSTNSVLQLPTGTTAQRPSNVAYGTIRFNLTLDNVEVWKANSDGLGTNGWAPVGAGGPARGRDSIIRTNRNFIDENIIVGPSQGELYTNGFTAGPVTVNTGVTVTVDTGGNWFILGGSEDDNLPVIFKDIVVNATSNLRGYTTIGTTLETSVFKSGVSGTYDCDLQNGSVFYFYRPSANNFSINIINLPTTEDRTTSIALICDQGTTSSTHGVPTSFSIDGTSYAVRWSGATPSSSSSSQQRFDIISLTIFSLGSGLGYKIIGQYSTFGS
jgi:hypothetical protein